MGDRVLWRDRLPILDAAHAPELEARAAVKELGEGKSARQAEDEAHKEYLEGHMRRAAAHHLAGLRASHAAGDRAAAASHGLVYGVLARHLGFSAAGEPPEDIAAMARDPEQVKVTEFKPHGSDALVLEHVRRKLAKSEDEGPAPDDGKDLTYMLDASRREHGERLLLLEGPTGRTVHLVRDEAGRRVPLAAWADEGGNAVPLGPAPGDVERAAALAMRLRRAAGLAAAAGGLRRLAPVLDEVGKAEGSENLRCSECGEFIYQTRKGKVGFHKVAGKLCKGSGVSPSKE